MANKNYVQINSSINITVTPGLNYQNATDKTLQIANKLRINPLWQKLAIDIKVGVHWYPADIAEWHSFKTLSDKHLMTIVKFADEPDNSEDAKEKEEAKDIKKKFDVQKQTLEEIAGE